MKIINYFSIKPIVDRPPYSNPNLHEQQDFM